MKTLLPQNSKQWLVLVFLTVFLGYALGTGLLLGPLRFVIDYSRSHNWSQGLESASVIFLIFLLIAVSLILAFLGLRLFQKTQNLLVKSLAFIVPLVSTTVAVTYMLNPAVVNRSGTHQVISERFTIGPYPEKAQIEKLKAEGYTGIISLLHPAVAPFEPKLLADEEANSKSAGIELIKAPMLPWLSENAESIDVIKELVRSGKGKYYIHCYLGKDRVNVVKNLINRISDTTKINSTVSHRTLEEIGGFERGEIYKVSEGIYFTPYPTKEEYLGYVLAGNYKTVISLLDLSNEDSRKIAEEEKSLLNRYELAFVNIPLSETAGEEKIARAVEQILKSSRPIVVHHWNTSSKLSLSILEEFKHQKQQVLKVKDL